MDNQTKFDPETVKAVKEQERIFEFVKGEDWQLVRRKLFDKIVQLDSISLADTDKLDDLALVREYKLRRGVISVVLEWIREIEGIANQAEHTLPALREEGKDDIIKRY